MPTAAVSVRRARWLVGESMNQPSNGFVDWTPISHRTLSGFCSSFKAALDDLFLQVLGILSAEGLIRMSPSY